MTRQWFVCSPQCPGRLWGPPSLQTLLPSGTEVKNAWFCYFATFICFHHVAQFNTSRVNYFLLFFAYLFSYLFFFCMFYSLSLFRLFRPFIFCTLSLYISFLSLPYILLFVCFFYPQSAYFSPPRCVGCLFLFPLFLGVFFSSPVSSFSLRVYNFCWVFPFLFHTHFFYLLIYFSSCFPLCVQFLYVSLLCPLSVLSFSIPFSL